MINSKIAHRFFIIAPVVIQSGSPHFIRLLRAENSGSIFILYTRYFPPFQYIKPDFFFQPEYRPGAPTACPQHIHSTLHVYPLYKNRGSAASAALPLPTDSIFLHLPAQAQ